MTFLLAICKIFHCSEIRKYIISGEETYENQKKFGKEIYSELKDIDMNGITIDGIHHNIDVVSSCDWKAAACIEGMTDWVVNKN